MVRLTGIESVIWLCISLKSLGLFFVQDSTRHPFVYFTVNIIIWIYKTGQISSQDTFICILMILIQGIGQTIYQQVVRLIEVGQ